MSTQELTLDTFEKTVTGGGTVLVDFWAEWCGPCRQFAPVFEAAADEHSDIVFAKVDTEAEQELAQMAGITSIPTLMVFRDGILLFNQPGALPPQALAQVIEQVQGLDMDEVRRQVAESAENPTELDLDSFAAAHAQGGYVLDVREIAEWEAGHVPGSVNIPMDDVPQRVAELPTDQTVHVICQSSARSRAVTEFLKAQGLEAITVSDGTGGWAARGWPLER